MQFRHAPVFSAAALWLSSVTWLHPVPIAGAEEKEGATAAAPAEQDPRHAPSQIGINHLKPAVLGSVDDIIHGHLRRTPRLEFVIVGIVHDGRIVLTKSYLAQNVGQRCVWASISKTVTAMIVMQLVAKGEIRSIGDNVWDYDPTYKGAMPAEHRDASLTIKHLLIHRSGLTHNAGPIWAAEGQRKVLALLFRPGEKFRYSTDGFAVLGDVARAVTGKTFNTLVQEYVAKPVGATSMTAREQDDRWVSPGAFVSSTIEGMARYSIGVMNHVYVSPEAFYDQMLGNYGSTEDGSIEGLGWRVLAGGDDVIAHHTGSNGRPQAYLRIKPKKKLSVSLFFRSKESKSLGKQRIVMGQEIMDLIEATEDPVDPQNPPPKEN